MSDSPEEEAQLEADAKEYHAEWGKLEKARKKQIPLMEMFGPTIQGEGTVLGQQTYFLRFGLCDYKCTMCDSLHAVLPQLVRKNALWLDQETIFERFWDFRHPDSTNWLTFSGGNPAIHDLSYLVSLCKRNGIKINVETQGTEWKGWLSKVDSLTISPKGPGMGEKHDQAIFMGFLGKLSDATNFADFDEPALPHKPDLCVKIVVFDQRDLEFAKEIFASIEGHQLFWAQDTSNIFYLSLGNPLPPDPSGASDPSKYPTHSEHMEMLLNQYRILHEDIQKDPILSKVRFTPQWHFFPWGNANGH